MKKTEKHKEKRIEGAKNAEAAEALAQKDDRDCPIHGTLRARGESFEGTVIRKFPRRITIQFERMIRSNKYERYLKARTKLHARLPTCMEQDINVGDLVKIQECRPLSKIIHFVVIKKIKGKEGGKE